VAEILGIAKIMRLQLSTTSKLNNETDKRIILCGKIRKIIIDAIPSIRLIGPHGK